MQQQKEIDLSKVVGVLKNNKKPIGITTGITTLIAIIYCISATPIFTAKILINPPKLADAGTSFAQVFSGLGALTGGGGGFLQKTDADVVMAMLNTNVIKDMVIKQFGLIKLLKVKDIELARGALGGKVKFIPDMKSGFLEIDVDDKDPKLAAAIANYYTVALGQLINNVAYTKANQRYQFYQEQLKAALLALNSSESSLKAFIQKNGIIAGQQAQVIAGISTQLQAQLVVAQSQLQSMRYYVSTDNPDYQALLAHIDSYKQQLDKLNNQNSDDNIAIPANLAPELANQYLNLMRDFTFHEVVYTVMVKQSKASQLDAQSEIAPLAIQVIDPATVPLYKAKPKRVYVCLGWLMFGLMGSCVYFIIRNRKQIIIEVANEK